MKGYKNNMGLLKKSHLDLEKQAFWSALLPFGAKVAELAGMVFLWNLMEPYVQAGLNKIGIPVGKYAGDLEFKKAYNTYYKNRAMAQGKMLKNYFNRFSLDVHPYFRPLASRSYNKFLMRR